MDKLFKKLKTRYQKFLKQAHDIGLSLPITLLIFLTFFSIITVAVIQTRRDTTQTRASGCPYLPTSAGKQLCDSACASKGGCTTCPGGGGYTCKNDVIEPPPNTTGNTGTGGTNPNLANCKAGFYRSAGACVGACGQNNCRECLRYGAGGYYECKDLPKPSTSGNNTCPKGVTTFYYESECVKPVNCASEGCSRCYDNNNPRWYCVSNDKPLCSKGQTCKDYFPNANLTYPNNSIFWPKSGGTGTYETLADCESQKNAKDANIICGNSATTTSTICSTMKPGNPYVLSNNRCYWCNNSKDPAPNQVDITKCNIPKNVICTLPDGNVIGDGGRACDNNGYYYTCQNLNGTGNLIKGDVCKNTDTNLETMPPTNGHCEPGIIGTNSDGTNKYAEKVPCNLSCSSKCPSGQAWATASNSTAGPCCYKTAIDDCISVTGMCQNPPVLFTYPQTTVLQQTITSPVITVEGETINCNQLTCIVL